jgi:hypothetical protein
MWAVSPVYAQPENDDLGNAILMTENSPNWPVMYTARFNLATQSSPVSCVPLNGDDIWFKFVAKGSSYSIYPAYYNQDIQAEIFSDPEGDVPFFCGKLIDLKDTLHDLTINQLYFLRLYNTLDAATKISSININFVRYKNVSNSTCSGAKHLELEDAELTIRDTAYTLRPTKNSCTDSDIHQLWYSFAAKSYRYDLECPRGYYFQIYEGCESIPLICEKSERIGSGYNTIIRRYKLEAGKNYLIQLYSSATSSPQASFLKIKPVSENIDITNDVCSDATELPVSETYQYTTMPIAKFCGQTVHACTESGLVDCWYKFEAISARQAVSIVPNNNSYIPHGFSVYESCEAKTPIACFPTYEGYFADLVPGKSYYIKANNMMYNSPGLNTFSLLNIGVKTTGETAINDDCHNANPITITNGTSGVVNGTLGKATLSVNQAMCITPTADVWYSFTAVSTSHYVHLRGRKVYYEIYEDCSSSEPILCSTEALSKLENLQPGKSYILRIIKTDVRNTDFSFSIDTQSPTDCSTPFNLKPGIREEFKSYSISSGFIQKAYCTGSRPYTWFSFMADSAVYVLKGSSSKKIVYVLKPDNCDTIYNTGCSEVTTNPTMLSQLKAGQKYLLGIAFKDYSAFPLTDTNTIDFTLSLQKFPNNNCTNAIELKNDEEAIGNLSAATPSLVTCSSTQNSNDLWYKFIPGSKATQIAIKSKSQSVGYTLFEGNCNGSVVYCVGLYWPSYSDIFNLKPGQEYFLRIAGNYDEFGVKVTDVENPISGDICETAIELSIRDSVNYEILDFNGSGYEIKPCISKSGYSNSIWRKFKPQSSNTNLFVYGKEIFVEMYDDCNLNNQVLCKNYNNYYADSNLEKLVLDTTKFYFLRITSYSLADPILIAVQSAIQNDDCTGAIPIDLTAEMDTIQANFINATASLKTSCVNSNLKDIWYQFSSGTEWVDINFNSTGNTTFEITNNCTTSSGGLCQNQFSSSRQLYFPNLAKNQTHYLRFVGNTYNSTTTGQTLKFTVKSIPPPANDDCSNPMLLPVSDTDFVYTESTLAGATSPTGTDPNSHPNVWYKFVSLQPTVTLKFTVDGLSSAFAYLYDSCNATYRHITNGNSFSVTPGKEYLLKLEYGRYTNYSGNLTSHIAIKGLVSPANDSCGKAISVTPSVVENPVFHHANLRNAKSERYNCYSNSNDIWYTFTANTNSTTIRSKKTSGLLWFSLYNSCESSSLKCSSDSVYIFTSVPGQKYYLSFFSTEKTLDKDLPFQFAVVENESVENVVCSSAKPVNVSQGECSYTRVDFTNIPVASSFFRKDIWYKFTASDSLQTVSVNSVNPDIEYVLYENCEDMLSQVINTYIQNKYMFRMRYTKFHPGKEYYLRIRYNSDLGSSYEPKTSFCISGEKAINDECFNAIDLTDSCGVSKIADFFATSRSMNYSCNSLYAQDTDMWFTFTTDQYLSDYALELTGTSQELTRVELSEACSSVTPRCIRDYQYIHSNYTWDGYTYEYLFDSLKTNTRYLVRLIHTPYISSNFSSNFTSTYKLIRSRDNDFRQMGWHVLEAGSCGYYYPCNKTSSKVPYDGGVDGFYDNWYSLHVEDTLVRFVLDNRFYYELYENGYYYSKTPLNEFYQTDLKDMLIIDQKLRLNSNYQLRIASRNRYAEYSAFYNQVCMYNLSEGNLVSSCQEPILLDKNKWYTSELKQIQAEFSSCLDRMQYNEQWFEITAGENGHYLTIEGNYNMFDVELFLSCNSAITCIKGVNKVEYVNLALESGQKYLVKVSSEQIHQDTQFRILYSDEIITSQHDPLKEVIKVYPNPTRASMQIVGVEDGQEASILRLDGTLISTFRIQSGSISTNNFLPGIYILDLGNQKIKFAVIK